MDVLQFAEGTLIDLSEEHAVVLRFRVAHQLGRMHYGTSIILQDRLVAKCWPPTGDHAVNHMTLAQMEAWIFILLNTERDDSARPETSYTSMERIKNDLPDDGSYDVFTSYDPPGIAVKRLARSCPRCRGSGVMRVSDIHEKLAASWRLGPAGMEGAGGGLSTYIVREVRCDHPPPAE